MPDIGSITRIVIPQDAVQAVLPTGNFATTSRWNAGQPLQTPVTLAFYFNDAPPLYGETNHGYTNASAVAWTAAQKDTITAVLASYATVANITFVEVNSTAHADMDFYLSSSLTTAGFAYYPTFGALFFHVDAFPEVGSNSYLAFHEIGHALGLAHLYDGGSKPTIESLGIDGSRLYSVVDQRLTPKPYYLYEEGGFGGIDMIFEPVGPMLLDIAALQGLYGANLSTNTGDDVYTFDINPNFYRTIWDAAGVDTIDTSNQINPSLISLEEGSYSTIGLRDPFAGFPEWLVDWAQTGTGIPMEAFNDGSNSLAIAFGAVIENAIGGPAADILLGNAVGNVLEGGAGNDTLQGMAGADTLVGGLGDDVIDGGEGIDTVIFAGVMSEYLLTTTATGVMVSSLLEGNDHVENVELFQFLDQTVVLDTLPPTNEIHGTPEADLLEGGVEAEFLFGYESNDTLVGGDGNDTLVGGAGSDTARFHADAENFRLTWTAEAWLVTDLAGTEGTDTLTEMETLQFDNRSVSITAKEHASYADIPDELWQFFIVAFSGAPGVFYMDQLLKNYNNGMSVQTFINIFVTKAQYRELYPVDLTQEQFARQLVNNVVQDSALQQYKDLAVADILNQFASGKTMGQVIYTSIGKMSKLGEQSLIWGNTARLFNNQVKVAKFYTDTMSQSTTDTATLRALIANVDHDMNLDSEAALIELIGLSLLGMELV